MTAYRFEHCRVLVDTDLRRVQTIFDDGGRVDAIPLLDPESIARARELGYRGSDADAVWGFGATIGESRPRARVARAMRLLRRSSSDGRFPRWRVAARAWFKTERLLGRLPMLIAVPSVGAVLGTALAVSHPAVVMRHGVVVVVGTSFWEALGLALAGAVGGVVVLTAVGFWGFWGYYRLLGGDTAWRVTWAGLRAVGGSLHGAPTASLTGAAMCVVAAL